MTDFDYSLLTPDRGNGLEFYKLFFSELFPRGAIRVLSGTGFDADNMQHRQAIDAVRYAIALQQRRDAKDYAAADAIRAHLVDRMQVNYERGAVIVSYHLSEGMGLTEVSGLIFDDLGERRTIRACQGFAA